MSSRRGQTRAIANAQPGALSSPQGAAAAQRATRTHSITDAEASRMGRVQLARAAVAVARYTGAAYQGDGSKASLLAYVVAQTRNNPGATRAARRAAASTRSTRRPSSPRPPGEHKGRKHGAAHASHTGGHGHSILMMLLEELNGLSASSGHGSAH